MTAVLTKMGIGLLALVLVGGEPVAAQERAEQETAVAKQILRVLPPARELAGVLSGVAADESVQALAQQSAANVMDRSRIPDAQSASFQLGVLLMGLEMAVFAEDKRAAAQSAGEIARLLAGREAPEELLVAVTNLQRGLERYDKALPAVSVSVGRPLIEAFVAHNISVAHMRLGEWAEAVSLMTSSELAEREAADVGAVRLAQLGSAYRQIVLSLGDAATASVIEDIVTAVHGTGSVDTETVGRLAEQIGRLKESFGVY